MYALTTRTPEDWQFKIIELMFNPASFAKVSTGIFSFSKGFRVFFLSAVPLRIFVEKKRSTSCA
jgi:hypothetical protein